MKRPRPTPKLPKAGTIKAGLDDIRRLAAADGPPGQNDAILKEAERWISRLAPDWRLDGA